MELKAALAQQKALQGTAELAGTTLAAAARALLRELDAPP